MKINLGRSLCGLWLRIVVSLGFLVSSLSVSADSFVGAGSNGKGVRSDDNGVTWANSNHSNGSMRGITFAAGRFVAVGDGVSHSDNFGMTWTDAATPPSNNMGGVAFGNGRFVAVGGNGKAAYSDDNGDTWTNTSHGNGNMFDVAYGNNAFVAVGLAGVASYSSDGISWTTSNHNNGQLSSIAFGNSVFVAGGTGTTSNASVSTDNGQTWSAATVFPNPNPRDVAFGNGQFVAVGFGGMARYSDDNGTTWQVGSSSLSLNAIAFGNNIFVAIGDSSSATSTDGINWITSTPHNNPQQKAIAFGADSATLTCVGFEPPLDNGPVTVKKNRVLPFKALLIDSDSQPVDDLGIAASPVMQVLFEDDVSAAVDVTDDALPNGAGTEGNQFEFLDSKWHFNLKIKNYTASGTYTVTMESGNASEYLIDPTCTGQFVID